MMSPDYMKPGTSNDYSSLDRPKFGKGDGDLYYPVSEGSNRDYTSLAGDTYVIICLNLSAFEDCQLSEIQLTYLHS